MHWVYRNDALSPIGEFNDLEFNYKFLMIICPLQVYKKTTLSNQNTRLCDIHNSIHQRQVKKTKTKTKYFYYLKNIYMYQIFQYNMIHIARKNYRLALHFINRKHYFLKLRKNPNKLLLLFVKKSNISIQLMMVCS